MYGTVASRFETNLEVEYQTPTRTFEPATTFFVTAPVATTVALAAVTLVASVAHSATATTVVPLAAQIAPLVK